MSKSPGRSTAPPGSPGLPVGADDYRRLFHELQVHQVELAQQNEELQEARSALAASLRRYVDLYEHAPVGLVTVDRHGVILEVNRRAQELLAGGNGDALIGRPLLSCLSADTRGALAQALAAIGADEEDHGVEISVPAGSAGLRSVHAEVRAGPRGDNNFLLALSDITVRQQAQAELARTREILELSNRVARIGYWAYELASGRMMWSAVAREIHGAGADYRPTLEGLFAFYRSGAGRLREALAEATGHGQPFDIELQLTPLQGPDLWVRAIGIAEMFDGRCQRLYGTFQDIDARVRAEQSRIAQARAEAANRSKSAFLARVSHELRTPLNAVLGFSHLLQRADDVMLSARSQAQVQHIQQAGQRPLTMVEDILDLSSAESGELLLQTQTFDVAPLLAECLGQAAALAAQRSVRLGQAYGPPGLRVRADRIRLAQLLDQLLSNAVKYNRDGGSVETGIAHEGTQVTIAIRDTGLGLNPEQLAKLFQPFERLGAEDTAIEGTGLGLIVARRLAEAMQGRLDVQSTPGVGSVFTLRLPAADTAAEAPFVVLYVEDNEVNVELMRCALAELDGVVLEVASDGEAGVEQARRLKPDLVLLDMNLPRLDGLGVRARLHDDPALAAIPCVAVSANAMADDMRQAFDAGFVDYLAKPVDIDRLLAVVSGLRATLRPAAPR